MLSGNVSAQGADIVVVGTIADDFIEVRQIGSELRILVNDFDHGTFQLPTGVIDVASLGGNDNIRFQAGVTVDAVVSGGAGNDTIRTGAGNDIIEGGPGADIIFGRAGYDELRGGSGNDSLNGGAGIDTGLDNGELLHISIEL